MTTLTAAARYTVGEQIKLVATYTDANGTPVNPGTVAVKVTKPDATTETPTVSNPAVGSYTALFVPATQGRYHVRWTAAGPPDEILYTFTAVDSALDASYTGDPSTSDLDMTRFLLDDTADPFQFRDTEISALLINSTPLAAAIAGAQRLASRYSGGYESKSLGGASVSYGDRAKKYRELASDLRRQRGVGTATIWAGGSSDAEKIGNETDSYFFVRMQEIPGQIRTSYRWNDYWGIVPGAP